MTPNDSTEDPLTTARSALGDSVTDLLKGEDYDDLGWLPQDFSDRLMDIAWEHRAELDGARFRRALKAYIRGIAPEMEKDEP